MYLDKVLIEHGFIGEGIKNGAVVVVKSHSLQRLTDRKVVFKCLHGCYKHTYIGLLERSFVRR